MEEFDVIETPENVDLQRRLAGIGSRFLAGFVDSFLLVGLFLALAILYFLFDLHRVFPLDRRLADRAHAWVLAVFILLAFLVYWGYFLLFELWMNGQTPGKRYMKIRVVRLEGGAVTFDALAVRNLLRVVDAIGFYAVAGITMFLTKKVQRLGDLAAGTVVISEEVPDYSARQDRKQKVLDDAPATAAALETTHLTPQEYRLLHNYWLRRDQLTLEARARLLPGLLRPILERTGMPLPGESLAALEQCVRELMRPAESAGSNAERPKPSQEAT